MGAFIAKQPNGLYCRFSSVTDCPTHWNMTREDYIQYKIDEAIEYARKEATDILDRWVNPFDGVLQSYIDNNMTKEEFDKFLEDVGYDKESE